MEEELLDQPIKEPTTDTPPEMATWRYVVTLLLFPAALLRLRSEQLDFERLLVGGSFSSLQFLLAGAIFALVRWLYLDEKGRKVGFWRLSLRTAVELVVFVGIGQLLWQLFA